MKRLELLPGLLLTVLLALAARGLEKLDLPPFTIGNAHPIDALILAVLLGMAVRNLLPLPAAFGPGVRWSVHSLLAIAIVLMGARLDFAEVSKIAGQALLIIVVCVTAAILLTVALCRWWNVGEKLGMLIGVGTAICGGTAIAVTAPVIEADDNDTAFAVTTITIFGVVSIFLFPALGHLFHLTEIQYGIWAGTAVHATPQVVAAGFAYTPLLPASGETATVVKLVRVLLLAPLAVGVRIWYARRRRRLQEAYVGRRLNLATLFPGFIIGFVLLAVAHTLRLLPDLQFRTEESLLWGAGESGWQIVAGPKGRLVELSNFMIAISMAGVGLGVHFQALRKTGLTALLVGLFSSVVLAGFSLLLITLFVGT